MKAKKILSVVLAAAVLWTGMPHLWRAQEITSDVFHLPEVEETAPEDTEGAPAEDHTGTDSGSGHAADAADDAGEETTGVTVVMDEESEETTGVTVVMDEESEETTGVTVVMDVESRKLTADRGEPVHAASLRTVMFMNGEETWAERQTTAGTALSDFPEAPSQDGKVFLGWYDGDREFTRADAVTDDMSVYAKYGYNVTFQVYENEAYRVVQERVVEESSPVGAFPPDPFMAGYHFLGWRYADGTMTDPSAPVTSEMVITGYFDEIHIYEIGIDCFYEAGGQKNVFDTIIVTVDRKKISDDAPVMVPLPAWYVEESTGVRYYPQEPSVTITASELDAAQDNSIVREVHYSADALGYFFVYMLKDIDGTGWTEIERTSADETHKALPGTVVTPQIREYPYAELERAEHAQIRQEGQELYVYYTRRDCTLVYDARGGSVPAPAVQPYGASVDISAVKTVREGYAFAGWYLDADYQTKAPDTLTLKADTTLYARWKGEMADYTVVYMKEQYDNASGTTVWVYDHSETGRRAEAGTVVRADEINAGAPDDGYEPAADKNAASSVVIEADGSAVLPYYYRLIRYTLVFNIARGSGRITIGGNTWSGSGYRIEDVVLGQDISAMWPSSAEEIYDTAARKQYFQYWSGAGANYITKRYELIWQNVSSADSAHVMTYTAGWTPSSQNRSAKYWLQQPDGTYAVEDAYTQTGLNTSNLGAKDISGYRIHNGSPAGYPASGYADGIYVYNFYYDRDAFTIDYYDAGTLLRAKEGILYEADISSSEYDYVPAPPAGKEDYSWGGWYADSALQTPYTFTVMPGSNVVVYAKWIPPQYTVTYRTDHDGTETIWRRTVVESGRMDTVPEEPVREGYSFTGWYTLASGGERYYPGSAPVYSDLTLYARWEAVPLRYTVKYVQKDTDKALYTEKTVENRSFHPGQRITEQAVPVAGYVPEQTSLSLSLSVNASENILIFEYVPKKERLSYTVRFVLKEDPSIRVAEDLTGEIEDSYARLTVKAAAVTDPAYRDYYPEELTKTIELGADSTSNTVYFYYVTDMVDVQTEWVDMTGTPIPGRETTRTKCRPGDSVRIDTAIPGYTLHHIKDNDSGEYFERQSHTVGTGSGRSFTVFMQKDLTIKVLDKTKVYDGTMLTAQGPDDVQAVGLMSGDVLAQVHASGGQTDAGTGYVYPDQAVITGAHNSSYYHISYEGGALTVTRRPVTLTSADARGQYNGAALTAPEVTVSGDGFARGQGADFTVTGEQTMPGSSDNTFTYALRDGTRAENYEITVIYGTLTVTDRAEKYQITVTSKDAKVLYDGTPKEAPALDMPLQVSVDGHEYFVDGLHAGTVGTDAGVYVNEIVGDPVVKDADGNDVTGQFTVSRSEGTLLINARTLILTSASAVRAYDGQPLTAAGVTWEGDGFADGEGIVCEMTGSQTQPGSSANTFTYSFTQGTKAENYHITKTEGTLTVTASEENLLISSGSGTWVYDGQPHTMPVYQVTYGETVVMGDESGQTFTLPTGDTLTITGPASVTDVADSGMGNNRFSYTLSNRDSYKSVTTVFGSLEVTPRNVILTSGSASREYNGTPLTEHKTTVSGDGFVDGEGVHINVTGSQTFVGGEKGNNRFTWEMQDGTRAENYEITPVYGTLIVTQDTHELIIRSDDGSWLYDGLPHTAAGVSVTYGGQRLEGTAGSDGIRFVLPAGDELTVQSQGLAVNTDDSAAHNNTLTWNLSGEDQYANVRVVPGTLIIRPREVVLTSESAEKVYDGEALTAGGISVSGDGFAEGEGILAEVTGSITQPGEQDNVFTYTFRDGTQSENYMIYPVYGTLTVLPAPEPTPTPGPTPAPAPLIPDPDNYRPLAVSAEVLSGKEFYSPGDQVEYEIMVVNFGNVPLTNIVVEDTISGRLEEIEYLSEGDVVFIQGVYTVSMEDVINGSVHNIITVKADDIDDPAVTTRPIPVQTRITVEISIIDLNTELQVSKRILNADPDHPFGLGDTIYYEIVVGNMGNVDYENVKVSDALTGLDEFIDVLRVGETRNYVTEYTVTSDDILAGTLVNHALAAGDPIPRPEGLDIKTPEGVGEIGAELEDIDLTLNVAKEVLTKGVVHEDETVEYAITVSNDGNVPYSNVEVVDELTDFYELIQVLEPGESRTFVTRYVVTRQDVIRGLIYNNAYAVGRKVEEADDTPGGHSEAEKPTGDRLRLRIRYYRDGELMDTYSGTYEYGDAYRVVSPPIPGYVPDKAVVWGTLTEDKTVKVFYTAEKYTLDIYYVFADGRQAAAPYKAVLETGQEYSVVSPVLAGYRPSQATVAGQMPSRNTQITVFYTVDSSTRPQTDPWQPGDEPAGPVNPTNNTDGTGTGSDPAAVVVVPVAASSVSGRTGDASLSTVRASADAVVITDYEVPLGVGNVSLNAGECIE